MCSQTHPQLIRGHQAFVGQDASPTLADLPWTPPARAQTPVSLCQVPSHRSRISLGHTPLSGKSPANKSIHAHEQKASRGVPDGVGV